MPLGGGSVRVEQSYDSGAAVLHSNEEQPATDEQATSYRVLLKGTDANAMRRAVESLTARLAQQGIRRNSIRAEWPEATTQLTLVPRPGIAPETAAQLAAALQERSYPPQRRLLPDGRALVAASLDAPLNDDDIPSAAGLFSRPMPIPAAAAFDVRREPVSGRVTRELGRFVLPIIVGIDGYELKERKNRRANVDRTLSLMHFPAGIVFERPPLGAWDVSREKLRLFGLAALLPSMLFALAAIVLSSLRRALLALAPALVGVACVSPALLLAFASMDEVVLLVAGAAVCCVTALSTVALLHFTGVAAMYRLLRRAFVPCAIGAVAGAAMLFIASTAGRGLGEAWRAPLLAAAVVLAAGITAIVLPAALVSFRPWRGMAGAPAATTAPFANNGTLAVRNLTKVYGGGFRALHGVSFELAPGVIGLLGPNGAGKTTLLRILTGLLLPTRGVVRYAGVDVRPETLPAYRERIGFLPQEFNAYAGLTAAQFLDYWALERGIAATHPRRIEVERLLAVARLEAHAGRKLRDFSGGMRQRIGIARALIGDPPLLVVDEPTTGLDIEARAHFRELITSLARERIIILSTHIASDVEATAARLLLLSRGRLVWDGTPEALIARADGRVFETIVDDATARELTRVHHITTRVRLPGGVRLRGIIAAGESLPGPRVEATLEEAYLAEIAPRERRAAGSFAFVYAAGER
jgi:ABC-2 type transport system ATP-binding protein